MIVAVIGLGTFGSKTAISLYEKGAEVIAVDLDERLVEKIKDRGNLMQSRANVIQTKEQCALLIFQMSHSAVVAIGDNIETSILSKVYASKARVGRVIARATSMLHQHVLKELGQVRLSRLKKKWGR